MRLKIFFTIAFLYSMQSYAGEWPVITSVTLLSPSKMKVEAQMMEIGPVADQIVDTNYYNSAGIATRQGRQPGMSGTLLGRCYNLVGKYFKGKPISEMMRFMFNQCSKELIVYDSNYKYSSCIGYVLSNQFGPDWSTVISPVGTCFQLADVNQWCSLTTPELNINHGVISVKEAAGNRAKQTMNINCTIPSKVTLTLLGGKDTIPIGGGTSHLTSSLGVLGKEISLQAGNNSVDIISELNNVKEGEWNASAVMMMELN